MNNNLMEDKSVDRFQELAGVNEGSVDLRGFEDHYELMDAILRYMDPEDLVLELIKGMGREKAEDLLDYIARNYNIYYQEGM